MARSRYTQLPQQTADEEMYAAFDNDEDEDNIDDTEESRDSRPLLASHQRSELTGIDHPLQSSSSTDNLHSTTHTHSPPSLNRHGSSRSVAGTYDFEYDYAMLPPPGSPPRPSERALPNSFGNSNGLLPTSPVLSTPLQPSFLRRAIGAVLPGRYSHDRRGGGLGNDGVFGNVVAKPAGTTPGRGAENVNEPYFVPEDAQKEAPPSYQSAQADSVPPYWENTILAPSGPHEGDMIIDNLPVGSVFAFLWNLLVSVSFQFVGFLLTYLLHTTHASKYGSRAGLGITLIQYGFYMRSAEAQLPVAGDDAGSMWGWPPVEEPSPTSPGDPTYPTPRGVNIAVSIARRALPMFSRAVTVVNGTTTSPGSNGPHGPFSTSLEDNGNNTSSPSDSVVSAFTPSDWVSFMLMTMGWFLLITSFLSFWRVKRWEKGVTQSVARAEQPREPTPEDLARNAQVLRSLEQAFGMGWSEREDEAMNNRRNVVTPSVQPLSGAGAPGTEVETDSRQGTRRLFSIV